MGQQPVGIDEKAVLPLLLLVLLHLLYDFQGQQRFVAVEVNRGDTLLHEHDHVLVLLRVELMQGQKGILQGLVVVVLLGIGDSQVVVVDKELLLVLSSFVDLYCFVEEGVGLSILLLALE